jgi:hypothetical protein
MRPMDDYRDIRDRERERDRAMMMRDDRYPPRGRERYKFIELTVVRGPIIDMSFGIGMTDIWAITEMTLALLHHINSQVPLHL